MSLVQTLPSRSLDIVGDVHGEIKPLLNLIKHLGYDEDGSHPQNRMLVFVGDLFDRGPDSPAVFRLIRKLVDNNCALAVLGNHEINLIRGEAKDGTGWFFEERFLKDQTRYAKFTSVEHSAKNEILEFLNSLPLALERDDLRIVHAAWVSEHVDRARSYKVGEIAVACEEAEDEADRVAVKLRQALVKELEIWPHGFESPENKPPQLEAHACFAASKQMNNWIKILTSGVERKGLRPFFSNGRWRFVERVRWWDEYDSHTPVVIGHYWRKFGEPKCESLNGDGDPDMFEADRVNAWHGKHNNVFCVDFSIGGKSHAEKMGRVDADCQLAALRWPERTLYFHSGMELSTSGFQQKD